MSSKPPHLGSRDDASPAPTSEEREVKIPVASARDAASRLDELGAEQVEALALEDDRLFDDAEGSLAARDLVVRLRRKVPLPEEGREPESLPRASRGVLTYKGPARVDEGHRVREEIETAVGDADALVKLLSRLGLSDRFRYQKRRRLYRLDGALVTVDETPLGDFVEIEGPADAIERVSASLGRSRDEWLTASYPALWRERHPDGRPMVFEQDGEGARGPSPS